MFLTNRMGYAVIALIALFILGLVGRLINRRLQPVAFPASALLPRLPLMAAEEAESESDFDDLPPAHKHGTTVKMQTPLVIAAPGAPNTDVPTDRHVTARGTATITRRTGRRRSTTSTPS